jgi:hypothetical protein
MTVKECKRDESRLSEGRRAGHKGKESDEKDLTDLDTNLEWGISLELCVLGY